MWESYTMTTVVVLAGFHERNGYIRTTYFKNLDLLLKSMITANIYFCHWWDTKKPSYLYNENVNVKTM